MIEMTPHISFYGRCREALDFYSSCLGGRIQSCVTFMEAGLDTPSDHNDKILHALFESQGVFFYAADGFPNEPQLAAGNTSLKLEASTKEEIIEIHEKIRVGGDEIVPLNELPDGLLFGIVKDRFNVIWIMQSFG